MSLTSGNKENEKTMRELIIETIQFPVGSITQPLTRWAADYDLPVALIYKRYYSGLRGAELLAPTPADILYYDDLKRLWPRKWVFHRATQEGFRMPI